MSKIKLTVANLPKPIDAETYMRDFDTQVPIAEKFFIAAMIKVLKEVYDIDYSNPQLVFTAIEVEMDMLVKNMPRDISTVVASHVFKDVYNELQKLPKETSKEDKDSSNHESSISAEDLIMSEILRH